MRAVQHRYQPGLNARPGHRRHHEEAEEQQDRARQQPAQIGDEAGLAVTQGAPLQLSLQPPQWLGSVCGFTQAPPHWIWPTGQGATQAPSRQMRPPAPPQVVPFGSSVQSLLDGVLAPLRNVAKFDPLLRLPVVLGVVHGLFRPDRRRRRPARTAGAITTHGGGISASP